MTTYTYDNGIVKQVECISNCTIDTSEISMSTETIDEKFSKIMYVLNFIYKYIQ